jgi:5-methylcytosine-specific restriction endonuclease McrA
MDDGTGDLFFVSPVTEQEIAREKAKARELRQSQWWKRRRSAGLCHYCGGRFPPRELTMDHVVPLVRGGRTVKSNVVPCCRECNARKRYLLPVEWAEYLARLAAGADREDGDP